MAWATLVHARLSYVLPAALTMSGPKRRIAREGVGVRGIGEERRSPGLCDDEAAVLECPVTRRVEGIREGAVLRETERRGFVSLRIGDDRRGDQQGEREPDEQNEAEQHQGPVGRTW